MLHVSFSRTYQFSASHRLYSDTLSDIDNLIIYDKCNNPNGHGHDYTVEVTLKSHPDPDTGMVYPLEEFDRNVQAVLEELDYRHLDKEVAFFKEHISTGEIIIQYLWQKMDELLPDNILYHIKLWETNNNYFELGRSK